MAPSCWAAAPYDSRDTAGRRRVPANRAVWSAPAVYRRIGACPPRSAAYGVPLEASANCVVVAARRAGQTTLAACVVLATTRADVNGLVRRHLDARKASFAPQDVAVAESGMAFGGITPVGLPSGWPVLVDAAVASAGPVVIGSGTRGSKLAVAGAVLAALPGAEVLEGLGLPPAPVPE